MSSTQALKELFKYIHPWRKDYYLGSIYSFLNKLFDIAPEILKGVDYVVDYGRNNKPAKPSAIIKLTMDGQVKVIRE